MTALIAFLPDGISPAAAAILIAASFFTSAVTAAFGIGGGVLLLALMSYLMPIVALIPVHGAVQFGSNLGRAFVQRRHTGWRRVLPFLAGSLFGAAAGAALIVQLDEDVLKLALGLFILIICWVRFPALQRAGIQVFLLGGAITAFLTIFLGATGPLVAIFFANAFDDRRAYVGSHATVMAFQHLVKVGAFVAAGFAFVEWLPMLAAMIFTGYLGTLAGSRYLAVIPEERFRAAFPWIVSAVAVDMIRRGMAGL